MRGTYDAKTVPYIIYKPTKFEKKNTLKIKEIITNILICVRVLINYSNCLLSCFVACTNYEIKELSYFLFQFLVSIFGSL